MNQVKKELLEEISKEVSSSLNPQKESLKLVQNANETYKQFESALKKPLDEELLKTRNSAKKIVQFAAEPIHHPPKQKESQPQSKEKKEIIQKEMKKEQKENVQKPKREQKQKPIPENKSKQTIVDNKHKETIKIQSESSSSSSSSQQIEKDIPEQKRCRSKSKEKERQNQQEKEQEQLKQLQHQNYDELAKQQHIAQLKINEQNAERNKLSLENQRINSLYDVAIQENKTLRQQLNDAKKLNEEYEKQLFELKQSSRLDILQMKDQLQESKFQQMDSDNKCNYLTKVKQTLEQNIKTLEAENQRLSLINQSLGQGQHQDKLVLLDKEGAIERLTKQLNNLENDYNISQKKLKETQEKLQKLQDQFTKVDNERNHIHSELEFRKNDQQEYLDSLKDKINKLTALKTKHDSELDKMNQQIVSIKLERDQYKQQFDQVKISVLETEELRKRLKLREVELEQLQTENDKLKWKIRKDPNGMLSDLKIMKLQADDPKTPNPYEQLQKQDNQIKQLTEDNLKLTSENKQLTKQIQQTELYMQEVKQMFDRERSFLEDKLHGKEKELNDLIIKNRHDIMDRDTKLEDLKRKYEFEQKHTFQSPYQIQQQHQQGKSRNYV